MRKLFTCLELVALSSTVSRWHERWRWKRLQGSQASFLWGCCICGSFRVASCLTFLLHFLWSGLSRHLWVTCLFSTLSLFSLYALEIAEFLQDPFHKQCYLIYLVICLQMKGRQSVPNACFNPLLNIHTFLFVLETKCSLNRANSINMASN